MSEKIINALLQVANYKLKEGTASSYYWQSGSRILPNRLSISRESEMANVKRKGRNSKDSIQGQLLSSFTQKEQSPLKRFKGYVCRTQIWRKSEFPLLAGYGTVGITNQSGKIEDTHDLLVFHTEDKWQTVRIFFFAGLGVPDSILDCMEYVYNLVNNGNII